MASDIFDIDEKCPVIAKITDAEVAFGIVPGVLSASGRAVHGWT